MIVLNGIRYRLTFKGRIVVGVLVSVLLLALLVVALGLWPAGNSKDAQLSASTVKVPSTMTTKPPAKAVAATSDLQQVKEVPKAFSIYFGPDKTELAEEFQASLDLVAAYVKSRSAVQVVVGGSYNAYPDLKGSYFENLSMERALNVAGYLKLQGVLDEQIVVVNLGGKKQLNRDGSKAELAKNRRVDISIAAKGQ